MNTLLVFFLNLIIWGTTLWLGICFTLTVAAMVWEMLQPLWRWLTRLGRSQ